MTEVLTVCVTGAAGAIGYSLVPLIANGKMFGPKQKVALKLLDITPMMKTLKAVEMELMDGAYPLLTDVVITDDLKTAFSGIHAAILVGAMPRREGMERSDLLRLNSGIFQKQGSALNDYADKNVKVLVVGNPANTNCSISMTSAPNIPRENFSCLTRLDHNRARAQIAARFNAGIEDVSKVTIWGNHSSTQYPDISTAEISGKGKVSEIASGGDAEWLTGEFVSTVQKRGAAVIAARGFSSAMSAANAISDHMHDWFVGSKEGDWVSMGVVSDGSYGIPEGIIYSFPVICKDGKYEIVKGIEISEFSRKMMDATAEELVKERDTAHSFLQ